MILDSFNSLREREREREFITGDIVLLQTHSDNTAAIEQKFTTYQKYKAQNQ